MSAHTPGPITDPAYVNMGFRQPDESRELLKAQLADAHKRLIEETKAREYLQTQVADLGRQITMMRNALRDIAEQIETL